MFSAFSRWWNLDLVFFIIGISFHHWYQSDVLVSWSLNMFNKKIVGWKSGNGANECSSKKNNTRLYYLGSLLDVLCNKNHFWKCRIVVLVEMRKSSGGAPPEEATHASSYCHKGRTCLTCCHTLEPCGRHVPARDWRPRMHTPHACINHMSKRGWR